MRPLRLRMSGFGPYRETNIIDMESLGRGGLYLITGDTGAGKTFIFDAITYALYGDMSGSGRDIKSVRSQYSSESEKTEVELMFEYRGRKYTVTRNPEYFRTKKSGEGTTKQTAGATLIKPDGSVIDGSTRVNEEIKNILGIDKGQFCSIAMIAQGEFRKVLNAGTDERQKLFRKLFNTQPYSRLSDGLKELNRKNQDNYNDAVRAINLCLSSVSCSFDELLSAELDAIKVRSEHETVISGEICELLESIINSGTDRAEAISKDLAIIEKRLTALNNTIALAEDHRKNVISLEAARKAIPELEKKVDEAKKALDAANENRQVIERLKSETTLIEASMDSYDELDAVNTERCGLEKQLITKDEELSSIKSEAEKLKKKLDDSESLLDEFRHSGEELVKIKSNIEKTGSRVSALKTLVKDIETVSELEELLKNQQEDLKPMLEEAGRLEAEHSKMLSDYMKEQAGILADSLSEGKPCPVCGSIHHPDPAKPGADAPSEDDIERKKKEAESKRAEASILMGEAQNTKGRLETVLKNTCNAAIQETGIQDLSNAKEAACKNIILLNESLEEMRTEEKELNDKAEQARELVTVVPELRTAVEEKSLKAKDIETEINTAKASMAAVVSKYKQVKKELVYDSKEDAQNAIDAKTAETRKLTENIETALQELNDAGSLRNANDARIGELERIVSGYKPIDVDAANEALYAAESEKSDLTDINIHIASELKTVRAALEAVRTGAEKLEQIRSEHEVIDSLNRTANGMVSGKERITLESYVQAFYFERIIRRANIRLGMMSDGQYEFVKGSGSGDKRHLSGLDLGVLDHYSGTERPVNTLSGGESFMASLSLALGLSDEVQASAGGIRLDTMFVDEGFGSLDSDTLEKAIRTLTELSDEDKLVGIISHVDALKSRIDRQIVVTKNRDAGSSAVIMIN